MRKYIVTICVMLLALHSHAVYRIYVSPSGYQDGLAWNRPCSLDSMVSRLTNDTISDEVFVYIAGGDYYNVSIKLWNLRAPIPNIHLIGGLQLARNIHTKLHQRDFVANETVFHADATHPNSIPIWLESFSYGDSTKISSVDGITITSDKYIMNNNALRLVGATYVITHCKIEDYNTTQELIRLESTTDHNFIFNSMFDNNVSRAIMIAWCKLHMNNTTIADNFLTQLIQSAPFGSEIDNSIIWGNYEQSPYYYTIGGTVDMSHSFIETSRTWMVDDYTNQWNVDPLFTYDNTYPYTCDAASTIFAYGDASAYYQYSWALTDYEYEYDIAGKFRFYDNGIYGIYSYADAGAYQHYYQWGGSNYESTTPITKQKKSSRKPTENASDKLRLWAYLNGIYVDGLPVEEATLTLYSLSGQQAYSTSLVQDLKNVQTYMQPGEYIASVTTITGELLLSQTIYLQ